MTRPYSVARLEDLERLSYDIVTRPVRLRFGIQSFGINAYEPGEGGHVIEEHDELGSGAGRHEELYFVARGHAVFTLDGEEIDAPAGTFVFISDPAVMRSALAREADTLVLVAGGVPGKPFRPSPWEAWLEAAPSLETGELDHGIAIFERALAEHPGNPNVLYNLSCFEALAGLEDAALGHLGEAVAADPRARAWAQTDADFDKIRSDSRFPAAG